MTGMNVWNRATLAIVHKPVRSGIIGLMIATDDGYGLVRKLNQAGIEASVIGKATDKNERILRNGEETRYMDKPQSDELYKIYQ